MPALLLFIKNNWKYILCAFAVLMALWAFKVFCDNLIQIGYDKCKQEQRAAIDEHTKDATDKNIKMDNGYEKIITKIVKVPSGCVSDADRVSNEWLRNNYNNSQ